MKYMTSSLLFLFSMMLIACNGYEQAAEHMEPEWPQYDELVAVVHPTDGNEASGVVRFVQTDEGVRVHASISGLDSESLHGFHIHEYGDCRAEDATSAGGHYNPTEMPHGGPTDTERHMGDLGNLASDENGVAELDYLDEKVQLSGPMSVLGLAVIVHAQRDDLESQPVGDAGARIGCGIIGIANPDF
jgi:superoxide dismutase, Cu-Zn family